MPNENNNNNNNNTKVLVVEPGRIPYVKTIVIEHKYIENEVGGELEVLFPFGNNKVAIVYHKTARICNKPYNRVIYSDNGDVCIIAGTFLVVGVEDNDICALSPDLISKYNELLYLPENYRIDHGIIKLSVVQRVMAEQYEDNYCKEDIEKALNNNYNCYMNTFNSDTAIDTIVLRYSIERISNVLANTIKVIDFDNSVSVDNKAWANSINTDNIDDYCIIDKCSIELIDMFTTQFRKYIGIKRLMAKIIKQ